MHGHNELMNLNYQRSERMKERKSMKEGREKEAIRKSKLYNLFIFINSAKSMLCVFKIDENSNS